MRVAFVIPSIVAGGAERVVVRLANYTSSCGVKTYIYVSHDSHFDYGLDAAVTVRAFPALNADILERAVLEDQIDVISDHYHWSLPHLIELGKLADRGVKVILSEHNSYFYPLFQYASESKREAIDLYYQRAGLYKKFNVVTSLTRYSAGLLSASVDNVVLMHNPVSYDDAEPSSGSQKRVLTVSSFFKRAKRIDLMIEAFARINRHIGDARFRVVGELDYYAYKSMCQEAELPPAIVEAVGLSKDVRQHYLESSVFAMTSEIEGQPMALLEAAMHCVPQVVFRIPGIEDQVIDGETGYIIEFGKIDEFASRIASILRDDGLRQLLGNNARDFVSTNFSFKRIGEQWMRLFESVHNTGRATEHQLWANAPEAKQADATAVLHDLNFWMGRALRPINTPRVSVIVPVYNTEDLLGRCIESLCSQTFKDLEIIVVSDASPGNVAEIVEQYAQRDPRVRFVAHERNLGLYQARSTGARLAQGNFIAHVDSDDFVHPEFIREMFETAMKTGADIVECGAVEVSTDGARRPIGGNVRRELAGEELFSAFANDEIRHVVWNKLYRKSLWDAAPLHMDFDGEISITEDLLRNVPLFFNAKKYVYINRTLYNYVRREASVVTEGDFKKMLRKLEDVCQVYDTVVSYVRNENVPEAVASKFRERQVGDVVWYLENGFKERSEADLSQLNEVFDRFGIMGAVASRQSAELRRLRDFERRFWEAEAARKWEEEQRIRYEQQYLEAEKGRLWEKDRADYFESQLDAESFRGSDEQFVDVSNAA